MIWTDTEAQNWLLECIGMGLFLFVFVYLVGLLADMKKP